MATHKLAPYWISVREFQEPDQKWDLTNIHRYEPEFPHNNLADYFWEFLAEIDEEFKIDEEDDKTFGIEKPIRRQGNTIEGRFKSGEWGKEQDVADIEEREEFESLLKDHHAPQFPFYFLFHIPDQDSKRALLLLSRYKKKGVKGIFDKYFLPRKRGLSVGDAYMDINRHYSQNVADKLNEVDEVASVQFQGQKVLPANSEYAKQQNLQNFDTNMSGTLEVDVQHRIKPKSNFEAFRQFAIDVLNFDENRKADNEHQFEYGELKPHRFEKANVTVKEGETPLTFSLWDEKFLVLIHIDSDDYDITIKGGFPTPDSMGSVARQVANDLISDRNSDLPLSSILSDDIEERGGSETGIPAQKE